MIACTAPLPHGPPVPAAVVLATSCGRFRLGTDGRVVRIRPAVPGGTGRRFEARLQIRRTRPGRFLLRERGRVVWRSSGLYPNDGGSIALGPHAFAFASYRRGVYVTDLRGPERRAVRGRGLYPVDFTHTGDLVVAGGGTADVVTPGGRVHRYAFRRRNGYAFDERTDTLFLVTRRGVLAGVRDGRLRAVRALHETGSMWLAAPGLLAFGGAARVTLVRTDGRVVARARWPRAWGSPDSGISVAPGGRAFAFRVTTAHPGARRAVARVYLARSGASHLRLLYRHGMGPSGCAVGASLTWRGGLLLYSSTDGRVALLDTHGRSWRLDRFARTLPHRWRAERATAAWS